MFSNSNLAGSTAQVGTQKRPSTPNIKSLQKPSAFVWQARQIWSRYPGQIGPRHKRTRAAATVQQVYSEVRVVVEKSFRNGRRLYAGVDIAAPVEVVWQALTDYDGLANFIPGLAENKCLERRAEGAQLLQVGEQDIALGAKFRATVILDIQEYKTGVPKSMCFNSVEEAEASGRAMYADELFPEPRSHVMNSRPQDIAFSMVKGDFSAFRGIWRMQSSMPGRTQLSYSLHVQPQPWLPIRLIQNRIEGEIIANLKAVRNYSERQWRRQIRTTEKVS